MKRIGAFFLCLALPLGLAAARIVLVAGGGLSNYGLSGEISGLERGNVFGLSGGAGAEWDLGPRVNFSAVAMLARRGGRVTLTDQAADPLKTDYGMTVLAFPLTLKYFFKPDGGAYLLAGLEWSWILSHRLRMAGDENAIDLKEQTRTSDWRIVAGGGYRLRLRRWDLFCDLRYNHGLVNLWSEALHPFRVAGRTWSVQIGLAGPRR